MRNFQDDDSETDHNNEYSDFNNLHHSTFSLQHKSQSSKKSHTLSKLRNLKHTALHIQTEIIDSTRDIDDLNRDANRNIGLIEKVKVSVKEWGIFYGICGTVVMIFLVWILI